MPSSAIPVLDATSYLAGEPGADADLAAELLAALEGPGCYHLAGHGISSTIVEDVFDASRRFHRRPRKEKMRIALNEDRVGYVPANAYVSRSAGGRQAHPNLVEAFFAKRESADGGGERGPRNQWPAGLPGFRRAVGAYCDAVEALCQALVRLYAVAFDLPADHFDEAFRHPHYLVRLSRYPPGEDGRPDQYGLAPHVDPSFLVVLAHDGLDGLAIEAADGTWIDVSPLDDALFVNSGDILRRWTNDRAVAPVHAVRNANGRRDRYVVPFFFDPDPDHVMTCLPTCQSDDHPARYPPTTVRQYLDWYDHRT